VIEDVIVTTPALQLSVTQIVLSGSKRCEKVSDSVITCEGVKYVIVTVSVPTSLFPERVVYVVLPPHGVGVVSVQLRVSSTVQVFVLEADSVVVDVQVPGVVDGAATQCRSPKASLSLLSENAPTPKASPHNKRRRRSMSTWERLGDMSESDFGISSAPSSAGLD
jgi:hypothetical protein